MNWFTNAIPLKQNLSLSRLGVRWNDEDVTEFFMNVVRETIHYRKESGLRRNDFMQLLIDMMKKDDDISDVVDAKSGRHNGFLTFEEIAAQAFVFFFAGYDKLFGPFFILKYNRHEPTPFPPSLPLDSQIASKRAAQQ